MATGPIVELPADCLPRLEALLSANGLPADDVVEQADCFVGIFDDDELVAAGGLEETGQYALLRSLVVRSDYRGRGLAMSLFEFLMARAGSRGVIAVYLLTETAAAYFERLGFFPVARADVPAAVASTRQFASLCPDSACCLMIDLTTV